MANFNKFYSLGAAHTANKSWAWPGHKLQLKLKYNYVIWATFH